MKKLFLGLGVLFTASAVHADVTSLLGDKDCFGVPTATTCPDGSGFVTDLGGALFTNYQTPGDPSFTDNWTSPGGVSYTHVYALPVSPISATLELRIAGIHDIYLSNPYTVDVNGTAVGTIAPNPDAIAFQEVKTYDFALPVGLLTGSDTVSWSGTALDGYIIDFSQLTVTTAVPEPGSIVLLVTAASLVGCLVRRRRTDA